MDGTPYAGGALLKAIQGISGKVTDTAILVGVKQSTSAQEGPPHPSDTLSPDAAPEAPTNSSFLVRGHQSSEGAPPELTQHREITDKRIYEEYIEWQNPQ
jgi:hypothetical protein